MMKKQDHAPGPAQSSTPRFGRWPARPVAPWPTKMGDILASIARILSDESPELPSLDLQQQIGELLTALAKSCAIDRNGTGELFPGDRAELRLVPDFPLPPVRVGGQDFSIIPSIKWEFRDEDGSLLQSGTDFDSTTDLDNDSVSVLVKPKVVELPRAASDVRLVSPHVHLQLSLIVPGSLVGATDGEPVTLKSQEVTLPQPGQELLRLPVAPVEIPTVAAFFRHKRFEAKSGPLDGFVLVVVDDRTPLSDTDELLNHLGELAGVAGPLLKAFPLLPTVLRKLGTVRDKIAAQPIGRFVIAQNGEIAKLQNIGMPNHDSRLDAGNAVSSLVLIGVGTGADTRTLECWNGTNFGQNLARFTLTNGTAGFAFVPDLHSDEPTTEPAGLLTVGKKPGIANTFGDGINAIRLVRA